MNGGKDQGDQKGGGQITEVLVNHCSDSGLTLEYKRGCFSKGIVNYQSSSD